MTARIPKSNFGHNTEMNTTIPVYPDKKINMDIHPFSSVLSSSVTVHIQCFNNTVVKGSVFIVLFLLGKVVQKKEKDFNFTNITASLYNTCHARK